MDIRPIRTETDHAAALKEIERLWNAATPGTEAGDRFEVLSTLVDAYEREHFEGEPREIPPPDPIEAIRFRMEQVGFTNKDLIAIFKTEARILEVMSKRRRLDLAMIRKLHEEFDIPLECLVQDYALKTVNLRFRQRRPACCRKRAVVAA